MKDETREWLEQAEEDFDTAMYALDGDRKEARWTYADNFNDGTKPSDLTVLNGDFNESDGKLQNFKDGTKDYAYFNSFNASQVPVGGYWEWDAWHNGDDQIDLMPRSNRSSSSSSNPQYKLQAHNDKDIRLLAPTGLSTAQKSSYSDTTWLRVNQSMTWNGAYVDYSAWVDKTRDGTIEASFNIPNAPNNASANRTFFAQNDGGVEAKEEWDYFRYRHYVEPEPSVTVGVEQSNESRIAAQFAIDGSVTMPNAIDLQGSKVMDTTGSLTLGGAGVEIPNGNLDIQGGTVKDTTGVLSIGDGDVEIPNGDLNVTGGSVVDDLDDNVTVGDSLHVTGTLSVAGSKNFVQKVNTSDGEKTVTYTSVEAGEARTEASGSAEVVNGSSSVTLPDHFQWVTSDREDVVVQVSERGERAMPVRVTNASEGGFTVEQMVGKPEDFRIDYTVKGVRKGFEDQNVVEDK